MGTSDASRQLGSPPLGQLFDDLFPVARRARNRSDALERRFVSRSQKRIQPFLERWQLTIEGHVQGVGFRSCCRRRALELGISGWVRNRLDGKVEVQAEGAPHSIAELRAWCEQGPQRARVLQVQSVQLQITGDDWFEVRY